MTTQLQQRLTEESLQPSDSRESQITEKDFAQIKVEINTLIWMHSPKGLTLEKADELACKILTMVLEGRL